MRRKRDENEMKKGEKIGKTKVKNMLVITLD